MDHALETLFRRFRRQGDPAALAEIFDRTAPELLRVATHLTRDPVAAEDLVQATYLAAIEAADRFDEKRPLLPWLLGILSNQGKRSARSRARRPDPTRLPGGEPPPHTWAVERRDLSAQVLAAIDRLDEPYRAAVVLRVRYGLEPAEIAHVLGRSPATVRSQIHRGLGHVRKREPALLANLVPFIPPSPRGLLAVRDAVLAKAAGSAAVAGAVVLGGLAVKKSILVAGAALLLLVPAALWGVSFLAGSPASTPQDVVTERASHPDAQPVRLQGRGEGLAHEPAPSKPSVAPQGLRRYPAVRRPAVLHGRVLDAGGAPLPGARVSVEAVPVPQFQPLAIADDRDVVETVVTDPPGTYRIEGLPEGPYALRAEKDGLVSDVAHRVAVVGGGTSVELRLGPAHAHRIRVRVVDPTGRAVSGALVEVAGVDPGGVPFGSEKGNALRGTTDDEGRVAWDLVEVTGVLVWARGPGGREGLDVAWGRRRLYKGIENDTCEVVVDDLGRLEGALSSSAGKTRDGLVIEAHARRMGMYYSNNSRVWRTTSADAHYAFDGLPAGTYDVVVSGGDWRLVPPRMWSSGSAAHVPTPVVAVVAAGQTTTQDLDLVRGGTLRGRVTQAGGSPVSGARVRATLDPKTGNVSAGFHLHGAHVWRLDGIHAEPDHPLVHRWTRTDAGGAYRLRGLSPGPYRLEVFAPGLSRAQVLDVTVDDAETAVVDLVLEPAGVLQGVHPQGGYLGVRRVGEEDLRVVAIVSGRSGAFTFAGLPAGACDVVIPSSWGEVEPRFLHRTSIEPGRTTWVDLGEVGPFEWRGRILLGGAPVSGARVSVLGRHAVTDTKGRATLRTLQPPPRVPAQRQVGVRRPLPGGGYVHGTVVYVPRPSETLEDAGDLELGGHRLALRTEDADGRPVSAALVLHSPEPWSTSARTRTSAAGTLDLVGVSAATYSVAATFHDGSEADVSCTVPTDDPVVVRAPDVGTLVVRVVDASGEPVERAYVSAFTWPGADAPPKAHASWLEQEGLLGVAKRADANGTARLEAVNAGEVLVTAQRPRGGVLLPDGATQVPGAIRLSLERGETLEQLLELP